MHSLIGPYSSRISRYLSTLHASSCNRSLLSRYNVAHSTSHIVTFILSLAVAKCNPVRVFLLAFLLALILAHVHRHCTLLHKALIEIKISVALKQLATYAGELVWRTPVHADVYVRA